MDTLENALEAVSCTLKIFLLKIIVCILYFKYECSALMCLLYSINCGLNCFKFMFSQQLA